MSVGNADRKRVLARADWLEQKLAELPAIVGGEPGTWDRRRAAEKDLAEAMMALPEGRPTTLRSDYRGTVVSIYGIRASSTSGLANALRNWIKAARLKASRP